MRRVTSRRVGSRTGYLIEMGLCAAAVLAAAVLVVAAKVDRSSQWREHEIRIDGQDDDWRGLTEPVKGARFSLGVVNDGEFVYFCLPSKDAGVRSQIIRQGLVFWLDKAGAKRESFGVHFPIGMRTDVLGRPRPDRNAEGAPEGQAASPDEQRLGAQNQVGILKNAGRDAEIVPLMEAGGIEAHVGIRDDLLVYELKVPLKVTPEHPFAAGLQPGDVLRVQIETASYRGPAAPLGVPGGGVIAGGGRGGGFGIGIGMGGGAGTPAFETPIRTTLNVKTASGPEK